MSDQTPATPRVVIIGAGPGGLASAMLLRAADFDVTVIERTDRMACPLLGIFGNEDRGPSPADVDDYEAALKGAGVPYQFHRYDGAGHGFQDFSNEARYCEEQSEDAWAKAVAFLDRHVKGAGLS